MITITGKYNSADVYVTGYEDLGESCYAQILSYVNSAASKGGRIAIMPDTHAGVGCVIGFTQKITDRVVPNLVGVDIGCLDKDTEFLSPTGWKKISEYNNDEIMLFDSASGKAYFGLPNAFIKNPCEKFYHFYNSKNLDQMFSAEHHMLVYKGYKSKGIELIDVNAEDFVKQVSGLKKRDYYLAKTTFETAEVGLTYTDDQIRVFVMISADGRLSKLKNGNTYTELHFRKPRKIARSKELLDLVGVKYNESVLADGSTVVSFSSAMFDTKDLTQFYRASVDQLKVLCDEVMLWDGTIDEKRNHKMYSSTVKTNADVVQFAFSAIGVRSTISCTTYQNENWNPCYYVIPTKNEMVSYKDIDIVNSVDGYKYCFNTPTGAFVIRRNDKISVTGNCGMLVQKMSPDVHLDLKNLDKLIHRDIPAGMAHRKKLHKFHKNVRLDELVANVNKEKLLFSIGSCGNGNHFIELDVDDEGYQYIVIHSGSRHLGTEVARYHQDLAFRHQSTLIKEEHERIVKQYTAAGHTDEIEDAIKKFDAEYDNVPRHLAYLTGSLMEDYLHDMKIAQEFAWWNREAMLDVINDGMGIKRGDIVDKFCTVHNYIDVDEMIIRKGAISLKKDEVAIIPMNMRDGSLIVVGKGNDEVNSSGPHGAGRLMSRSDAKQRLTMDEFKKSMEGIYTTSVNEATLDEAPMAYKSLEEIADAITPTAKILARVRPIYNFKAGE